MLLFTLSEVRAQLPKVVVPEQPQEDYTWWYVSLFVLGIGLVGAVFWMLNGKKKRKAAEARLKPVRKTKDQWGTESVDFGKELEWFRKNQNVINKKPSSELARTVNAKNKSAGSEEKEEEETSPEFLPVFSIRKIQPARDFDPLPLSNDESLMSAIEQAQDEFEEDENVRDLAVRVLTAFRTRNSIEALSQIALYDLSSNLRSKAVAILSDFDHESVFEMILLACADPTREVRAAAARGLFKLSFDRADAWTRIAEGGDEYKMRQAARASIEGDLVERSLDRLVHPDMKYAYEAFTLVALLVKAGETEVISGALENHKNLNVRKAILHVIKVIKEQNAVEWLCELLENDKLPAEIKEEINLTIEEIGLVPA